VGEVLPFRWQNEKNQRKKFRSLAKNIFLSEQKNRFQFFYFFQRIEKWPADKIKNFSERKKGLTEFFKKSANVF
jgi:hypothetical protein